MTPEDARHHARALRRAEFALKNRSSAVTARRLAEGYEALAKDLDQEQQKAKEASEGWVRGWIR